MRKLLLILIALIAFTAGARKVYKIGSVDRVGKKYRICNPDGKKLAKLDTIVGRIAGYAPEYLVVETADSISIYSPAGHIVAQLSRADAGSVIGVFPHAFTTLCGNWIITFTPQGREDSRRLSPAQPHD